MKDATTVRRFPNRRLERVISGKWKEICATAKRVTWHAEVLRRHIRPEFRRRLQLKILFYLRQNVDIDILLL